MSAVLHELAVERHFAAPRAIVWRAITDHLIEWWCPRPWRSEIVALDWIGGGRFAITMHGPAGEVHAGDGTMLEVEPQTRFVFTNMIGCDWTPQNAQPIGIIGRFELADAPDGGTSFRSGARHWSEADLRTHDAMGFAQGWGACADQLGQVAARLMASNHA